MVDNEEDGRSEGRAVRFREEAGVRIVQKNNLCGGGDGGGVCVCVCVCTECFCLFERTDSCDYRGCQVQSLQGRLMLQFKSEGCCRIPSCLGRSVFALLRLSIYLDEVH